ncbi:Dynamin-like GTPase that mediates homotypic ER fusion [Modicella reniformis]|uniref:Dynamin-like GTPase that mediates homotypic ER fusion n=1 Tax=Modicella reniformis TaxID=1440133 RepID=A0A9P6SLQ0_9FUNG|nr:Dynamin-like GTPase that mediates homotypic ER fusion [Modicella reniformis]
MLTNLEKHLRKELDEPVGLTLNNPTPSMWNRVITIYQNTVEEAEKLFQKKARTFDLDATEQTELIVNLRRQAWVLLTKKVQEESVDGMMLLKLRNKFEEKFRYDEHGLPRVWKPDDDIDTPFRKARDETVRLVPLFATIDNTDPVKGAKFELEPSEDFDFDQSLKVLSESRQQEITIKFKRESDAFYLEAKRSVVSTQAKVPYWVGVALIILGWNEFIAVIKNPLYLMVVTMVGVPMMAMWYLDMLGLAETIARKAYDQGSHLAMNMMRDVLDKDKGHPQQLHNRFQNSNRTENGKEEAGIELNSLDSKKGQ